MMASIVKVCNTLLLFNAPQASTTSAIASRLEGENSTLRAELAALRSEIETLVSNERQAAMRADSLRRTLEKVIFLLMANSFQIAIGTYTIKCTYL